MVTIATARTIRVEAKVPLRVFIVVSYSPARTRHGSGDGKTPVVRTVKMPSQPIGVSRPFI